MASALRPLTTARGVLGAAPRTAAWAAGTVTRRRVIRPAGRPAPVANLRLTGNVALDELFLGAMVGSQPPPEPDELARAASELAAAGRQFEERGWLADPAAFHRTPPPLDDGALSLRPARWWRERYELLTAPSRYRPRSDDPGSDRWSPGAPDRPFQAALLRHDRAGRRSARPWVVCIHGFGTGTPQADFLAFHVRRLRDELGADVALPVLPLHGPRRQADSPQMLSYDLVRSIHALAQAVWDVRRLVRWIRSTSDGPVVLYGVSLGGYTASLVAGLEPVDAVVAGVPAVDLPALFARHSPDPLARTARSAGLLGPEADRAFRVVSPLSFEPLAPHEHRTIYAGLGDRFVPARQPVSLWEHWGHPRLRWYPGGHIGFLWSRPVNELLTERLEALGCHP